MSEQRKEVSPLNDIWYKIKESGLSFMMMAFIVVYLTNRQSNYEKEISACNQQIIEYLQTSNTELIKVVQQNTMALELHKN